jgi:AcrR family transcriptional regulator
MQLCNPGRPTRISQSLTLYDVSVTDNKLFYGGSMPRSGDKVRRRLQQAALELFGERGYELTTAAEIAAKAGVTERTFFRHFADKREVLFDGESVLSEALQIAVREAPTQLGPWDTLLRAFGSAEYLFVENRPFAEPRHRLIAGTPALQERALAKTRSLIAGLASALRERGIPEHEAVLAAQMGMAALAHAVARWFDEPCSNLSEHLSQAFLKVRDLSASGSRVDRKNKTAARR